MPDKKPDLRNLCTRVIESCLSRALNPCNDQAALVLAAVQAQDLHDLLPRVKGTFIVSDESEPPEGYRWTSVGLEHPSGLSILTGSALLALKKPCALSSCAQPHEANDND